MLRSKISNGPERNTFAASLKHLKLRRELKEAYMEVGESKGGWITGWL